MQLNRRSLLAAAGLIVALVAVIVVVLVSGGDDDGDTVDATTTTSSTTEAPASTTTTTTVPDLPIAPLTGLELEADSEVPGKPAIVVKISNNFSVPDNWHGIDRADVVIEERIEDNATRFAVVFHSDLPDRVGPIRSARTSDIDLLANLGNPILVYSGANGSVSGQLQALARDGLVRLVVDRDIGVDLVRDPAFPRPDNLFSNLIEIDRDYGADAGVAQPLFEYLEVGDGPAPGGVATEGVTVVGQNDVSFVWDEALGFVRVQDGEIQATDEGTPFAFDNVVVLEVVYTRSTIDPDSVDARTVDQGPVTILANGEQRTGTWIRESRDDQYRFLDADGVPMLLDPGQTWMTLVPAGSYELAVAPEIAALVTEGEG